jgi:hypothetical protein
MISCLLKSLLLWGCLLHAETIKPLHVLSLSGAASLLRFEEQGWPMEVGQDLPGDVTLTLEKGGLIGLSVFKRVDMLVSGPATLRLFSLERQEGEALQQELVIRIESGACYFDPRFLLGRPSNITLELPDTSFEVDAGMPFMVSRLPGRKSAYATVDASGGISSAVRVKGEFVSLGKVAHGWPEAFNATAKEPVPILVLGRDYDKELKVWPRPAVLGPALMEALKGMKGLRLVDGSGSTTLAYFANNALRTGQDFFVQTLARERGARFVLAGNLVVEELREESSRLRRHPLMSAVAELRVLEAFERGDVVVSDVATTLCARAGRALETAGREALQGAAQRAARYVRADLEQLLQGQAHPPLLLKMVFHGVDTGRQRDLRRALSDMDAVQRFFKRSFAGGVFKIDVVLRKSEAEFLRQLKAWDFQNFTLDPQPAVAGEGLDFRLSVPADKTRKSPD